MKNFWIIDEAQIFYEYLVNHISVMCKTIVQYFQLH